MHVSKHFCDNEETLHRLPVLLAAKAVDLRGKRICLHDFRPSFNSRPSIQRAEIELRGDGTPGPATGVDEHEDEDGGNKDFGW